MFGRQARTRRVPIKTMPRFRQLPTGRRPKQTLCAVSKATRRGSKFEVRGSKFEIRVSKSETIPNAQILNALNQERRVPVSFIRTFLIPICFGLRFSHFVLSAGPPPISAV
jgi:hypothetical protein